jgi:hypothetical protein
MLHSRLLGFKNSLWAPYIEHEVVYAGMGVETDSGIPVVTGKQGSDNFSSFFVLVIIEGVRSL